MLAVERAAAASPWRHRHPAEKALLALGLLGCALVLPPWPGCALVAVVALGALLGPARVRPRLLARVLRGPLALVAVGVLPLLVSGLSLSGAEDAVRVAARSAAALCCLVLLTATTPLSDVVPRLLRVGVPAAVVEVMTLVYSMLSALLVTRAAVQDAQAARLGFRTWRSSVRSAAAQGSTVFVRAFARAQRLEEGLRLRGGTGALRVLTPPLPLSPWRCLGAVAVVAAVAAVGA